MQGGVGADGHVSATEVIVDRANHADDVQVGRVLGFFFCDLTYKNSNTDSGVLLVMRGNILCTIYKKFYSRGVLSKFNSGRNTSSVLRTFFVYFLLYYFSTLFCSQMHYSWSFLD